MSPVETTSKPARGAGGTPGGIGTFFLGLAMAAGGGYLVLQQVIVSSHFSVWGWPGPNGGGFGPLLIALMIGIGILFFNAKNWLGRIIAGGSLAAMVVSVIMNLELFWRPTSLLVTLAMFGLLAGGIGLIFRSFRSYEPK
jgi:ABC-type Na+ efflux pump permease subunit